MGGAVGAHGGAVDAQIIGRVRLRRQGGKDARPQATMAPAVEAVVDRGRGAVFGRAVLPTATDAQHMDDTADDTPVVHPPRTWLVPGKQRLDGRPGLI